MGKKICTLVNVIGIRTAHKPPFKAKIYSTNEILHNLQYICNVKQIPGVCH